MAPRRIVSAPVRTLESSNNDAALIETLCVHPDVRIVSFVAAVDALPPSPTIAREQAGTLASTSRLQRTIAVGSCRIYKAPGSVAFISCGAALQPILPKSQCWAIDEHDCTFALQIRRPTFWRIELPSTTDIDLERAKTFRETLSKILQFEKTPCPFQRSFTIELPEEPDEPVKKIPWTPKRNGNDYRPVTAGAALGGNPDWTPPDADLALRYARRPSEHGHRTVSLDVFAREARSEFPETPTTVARSEPDQPDESVDGTATPRTTLSSNTSHSDAVDSHETEEAPNLVDKNPIAGLIREFDVLSRGRDASHPILSREGCEMLARQCSNSPKSEETHTKSSDRRRRSSSSSKSSFATPGEACFIPTQASAWGQDQDSSEETREICRSPSVDSSNPTKPSVGSDLPKTVFTKTFSALIAPPTYLITLMLRIAAQLSPPPHSPRSTHDSSRFMHMPGQWDDFGDELSE